MLIKATKLPKILFIKDVFKKDCLSDDIFDKKILDNINTNMKENVVDDNNKSKLDWHYVNYTKLSHIFESIETWNKKSNLLCWNCTLSFDSIPVFIPDVIEPATVKNKAYNTKYSISVYGVFCSFGCAHKYVETHNYSLSERIEAFNKLKMLHKLFYNKNMRDISHYPSHLQMKQYGGDLTVEEFRAQIEEYKKENI